MPSPKPERTRYPGIYKRGTRYAFVWRDAAGRQRWGSERTIDAARRAKAEKERVARRGGLESSDVLLVDYLRSWVADYQGTGRRGFREESRHEYRLHIEQYLVPFFGPRMRLAALSAPEVGRLVAKLTATTSPRTGRPLADSTIANILKPLRAAMRTARAHGLLEVDPTHGVAMPHRPQVTEEGPVKALTDGQLQAFLACVNELHQLMFAFAAATGLRASEVLGLDVRHLALEGPYSVQVRQRYRRGKVGALKSRHATRDVPLDGQMAAWLREHIRVRGRVRPPTSPVFTSLRGTRLMTDNVKTRVIDPAAVRVGEPWIGWHSFRHTCASRLFAQGRNIVQVQKWLGHHAPSFTLDTYVHLLDEGMGDALEL